MSADAPKRIWCGPDADGTWDYVWAELEPDPDLGRTVEYVLAAEIEALRKENERLRVALGRWDALIEELPGENGLSARQVDQMCRVFNEARAALQGETE